METVLDIRNLTVSFGSFKAVDDISFSVEKGEIFGFLGANGAGKTTAIRAMCGLLNPSAGEICVKGKNIAADTSRVKSITGYMSQKFTLYRDLTVRENMLFSGSLYALSEKKSLERMRELFKYTGFDADENEFAGNLSGGTKQIISLCASLLHEPDIVFLDEPTAGISPVSRLLFWNLIRKLSNDGKTVFVTTHYMDEAEYCGRIALMQAGKIIGLDSPAELKKKSFPEKLYEISLSEKGERAKFEKEISEKNLGDLSVYGMNYHLDVKNENAWQDFLNERKDALKFEHKIIEPSLEDVFIKLVGR